MALPLPLLPPAQQKALNVRSWARLASPFSRGSGSSAGQSCRRGVAGGRGRCRGAALELPRRARSSSHQQTRASTPLAGTERAPGLAILIGRAFASLAALNLSVFAAMHQQCQGLPGEWGAPARSPASAAPLEPEHRAALCQHRPAGSGAAVCAKGWQERGVACPRFGDIRQKEGEIISLHSPEPLPAPTPHFSAFPWTPALRQPTPLHHPLPTLPCSAFTWECDLAL